MQTRQNRAVQGGDATAPRSAKMCKESRIRGRASDKCFGRRRAGDMDAPKKASANAAFHITLTHVTLFAIYFEQSSAFSKIIRLSPMLRSVVKRSFYFPNIISASCLLYCLLEAARQIHMFSESSSSGTATLNWTILSINTQQHDNSAEGRTLRRT
jgi:hypothetical protein